MTETRALSFAQEHLWLADQDPASALPFLDCAPTLSLVVRLRSALDHRALRAAVREIVRRHDVLRSRFVMTSGRPASVCEAMVDVPFSTIDLRALPPRHRSDPSMGMLARLVERPFDLSRGPLLRVHLLALADDDHVVAITVHHIVFDRWSRRVLASELKQLYEAYATGRPARRAPLAASYGDYVRWQRDRLGTPLGRELAEYWTARMSGLSELVLPRDGDQGSPGARSGDCWFEIPASDVARLRALSRGRRVTLTTTVLAIFALLLHRLSGQDDIAIGVPLSDRRHPDFEPLIGLFMNVVVLRTSVRGDMAFPDLLDRVRRDLFDACRYQDLPYGYLLKLLGVSRPLYRVVFNFMPAIAGSDVLLTGLQTTPLAIPTRPASIADFSLHLRPHLGALVCRLVYRTDVFSPARAHDVALEMQRLVGVVVRSAGTAVVYGSVRTSDPIGMTAPLAAL